jgi:hypothetical protein
VKIIGNIKPLPLKKYKQGATASLELTSVRIGDIASESIEETLCRPLAGLLEQSGYGLRHSLDWHEPSLNAIKGSVGPHEDKGLGLVAFWLLHKQQLGCKRENSAQWLFVDDPWLFAGRVGQRVSIGDVVVFDANKTHSWMCNGEAYAISQTISRRRKS